MTDIKPLTYEWFVSLKDDQLYDIGLLNGTGSCMLPAPVLKDLITALSLRLKEKMSDD